MSMKLSQLKTHWEPDEAWLIISFLDELKNVLLKIDCGGESVLRTYAVTIVKQGHYAPVLFCWIAGDVTRAQNRVLRRTAQLIVSDLNLGMLRILFGKTSDFNVGK